MLEEAWATLLDKDDIPNGDIMAQIVVHIVSVDGQISEIAKDSVDSIVNDISLEGKSILNFLKNPPVAKVQVPLTGNTDLGEEIYFILFNFVFLSLFDFVFFEAIDLNVTFTFLALHYPLHSSIYQVCINYIPHTHSILYSTSLFISHYRHTIKLYHMSVYCCCNQRPKNSTLCVLLLFLCLFLYFFSDVYAFFLIFDLILYCFNASTLNPMMPWYYYVVAILTVSYETIIRSARYFLAAIW